MEEIMKRSIVFSLFGIFLLAACAAPMPTPTLVPIVPTATTVPKENTAIPSVSAQTQPAVSVAANTQTGVVIYKIVPAESQVSYEVAETFLNDNRFNLAIGVTKQITGEITADKTDPTKSSIGPITVDISQFTSDSNRRDSAIRSRWLESEKFPQAVFTPTKIESLPSKYEEGKDYSFKVTGDLKVREVTKPVTFDVTAQLNGDVLSGTAGTTILLSDFGVGPISIGGMLNTEDQAKLNLKFVAKP
jgi:polyisoprenoid-binding protein YceI